MHSLPARLASVRETVFRAAQELGPNPPLVVQGLRSIKGVTGAEIEHTEPSDA